MIQLELGLDAIRSYKRLAYTPWHALAEFVDNSTQSYLNNREALDLAYAKEERRLTVSITYDRNADSLSIADNAMGMSFDELKYALHVGAPPANAHGRSQFGMGLKTAACWFGNRWSVRTKKLGETEEYTIDVDVERVASGSNDLPFKSAKGKDEAVHYTVIEIRELNRKIQGRALGKVRDFLRSMYRKDLSDGTLTLLWQGEPLKWEPLADFITLRDGSVYRKPFEFQAHGRVITGWVGVLSKGGRDRAGFAILQHGRVIKGWPDAWRPESLFGQYLGSNDLVNQRLVGEINLDGFAVTHTKDDIQWMGTELDDVEEKLLEVSSDYREVAKKARKGKEDERGPADVEVRTALEEFQQELSSDEMIDSLSVVDVPPPELVAAAFRPLLDEIASDVPAYSVDVGPIRVVGYLAQDTSPNDPYVVADSSTGEAVVVVINMQHPHFKQLMGSEGVLNYLRHCTYDALAEWQARKLTQELDSDTIKLLKDRLLRVPLAIEMHARQQA